MSGSYPVATCIDLRLRYHRDGTRSHTNDHRLPYADRLFQKLLLGSPSGTSRSILAEFQIPKITYLPFVGSESIAELGNVEFSPRIMLMMSMVTSGDDFLFLIKLAMEMMEGFMKHPSVLIQVKAYAPADPGKEAMWEAFDHLLESFQTPHEPPKADLPNFYLSGRSVFVLSSVFKRGDVSSTELGSIENNFIESEFDME
ncbi:unnamed protein product [Caenorhabditis auriculariae]|uniref:Uncharacterized protein n=1 Tax=Caenorhabditis auriculariae TaxID=2777116 RepID=A0A8S1H4F8_9PELO|nr:unnamed protein product [Caenorhabditis auriculariae]